LCTRSIAAASFERVALVAAGTDDVGRTEAVVLGVAGIALRSAVALGVGLSVAADAADTRGLAMNPASAIPAASVTTIANGAIVSSAVRDMRRIFIAPGVPLESNGVQRRCRDRSVV
jgi:hypothetical protein